MTLTPVAGDAALRTASPLRALTRDLHLVSPPMAGADVLTLQHVLATAGYHPGRLDGIFGDATAAAVRAFQRAHGLEADGWVGRLTREALAGAAPATTPAPASSIGVRALAEARRHLDVREDPPGSNRTRFGRWFGVDGVPWCNIFVSYCFAVGAGHILCQGLRAAGVTAHGCAYVPTTEAWLRSTGQWLGRTTPRPGDIAIYNWDRLGVPEHIGIVENYLGSGKFAAIEGNTAVGRDSDGGCVMRRQRYVSQVDGFGRIHG